MGRGAALLGAAALLLLCASAQATPPRQAALRAVLAYEAAQPREQRPVCVAPRSEGITFDEERRQLREERRSRPVSPRDVAWHQRTLTALEQRRFDWRVAPPPGRMGPGWPPRLDPAQAELLSAAARPYATADPGAVPPVGLGPIPAPFRAGISPDCRGRLALTAPVGAGDLLFVQSSYDCGGLCGVGWLYALRPDGHEWRIVAIAWTWVS
jgi:hypothetical protein